MCFAVSVSAKLGETVPKLVKRFGDSYTIESDAAGKKYKFRSEKVSVDVLVSNDVSVAETYFSDHPLTTSGEPPNDIVRAILKTNVPQTRWLEIDASPFGANYALSSSDQKHIALLRYTGPQPEGSVWTMTVGLANVVGAAPLGTPVVAKPISSSSDLTPEEKALLNKGAVMAFYKPDEHSGHFIAHVEAVNDNKTGKPRKDEKPQPILCFVFGRQDAQPASEQGQSMVEAHYSRFQAHEFLFAQGWDKYHDRFFTRCYVEEGEAAYDKKAAEQGDPDSQVRLAQRYQEGVGVPQDYCKAAELYEKAAAQGNALAQVNLGWLYDEGKGVSQDYRKAAELYQKSADQGNAAGKAYLASQYAGGKGVPQDYRKAIDLYQAAIQGDSSPNAFNDFAWFLATCADVTQRNGKKAVEYATKACELTQWGSRNFVGTLAAAYAEIGDFDKAIKYQKHALGLEGDYPSDAEMERSLTLYEQHKPFRSSADTALSPTTTSEPNPTPKQGPKPGETKEQYEQRVMAEQRAKDAAGRAQVSPEKFSGMRPESFPHATAVQTPLGANMASATPVSATAVTIPLPAGAPKTTQAVSATPAAVASVTPVSQIGLSSQWVYHKKEDEMGRGTNKFAHLKSLNTVDFGFPYQGEQHAILTLQKNSKQGVEEAILRIEHGQFVPSSGHKIIVRFDDGNLQEFNFWEPNDGRIGAVGFSDSRRFISQLQKAKRLKIEAEFWQEGTRMFEFNVAGLSPEWVPEAQHQVRRKSAREAAWEEIDRARERALKAHADAIEREKKGER